MTLLFTLAGIIVIALTLVSFVNRAQKRERARRMQQRQLRLRIELLEEVLDNLMQTLANRDVARHVNAEILDLLKEVLHLERKTTTHIESLIKSAENRGQDLANSSARKRNHYIKDSDVQIIQTQHHITLAGQVLRHQHHLGRVADEELQIYLAELDWANLMISVVSFISQGYKASSRGDIFSAQAFYKKAQSLLIESMHPDPKRMRMIKELGEIVAGTRKTMSEDLVPEEAAFM